MEHQNKEKIQTETKINQYNTNQNHIVGPSGKY